MEHTINEALTFDDVLLVPAASDVLPHQVSLDTRFTRSLTLHIPLVSAAMDTVTEADTAICLAQEGGIGVIHRNMKPARQGEEVRRVKKYETGVIIDPITVDASTSIAEVLALTRRHHISGVPVLDGGGLAGIVTNRDLRFETRMNEPVRSVMTPREKLVTVKEGASRKEIERLLHAHRIEKILVVDDDFGLKGLITVKDIQKSTEHPNACKDADGRLLVAAAVGVGADTEERVDILVQEGIDAIVVDTAHGHSNSVIDRVRLIKRQYGELQVVAGNIATPEAARDLIDVGVDALKVGIGPGSICTTRMVAGVGVPQVTAVMDVVSVAGPEGIPVIADGGIRFSGDIAKAIAAGAHSVMVGGLLGGTEEAPGEIEIYQGRSYKSYRGMGSLGAMETGSRDRYFQEGTDNPQKLVPEGIEGRVPYKGPAVNIIHQLIGGVRASMGYTGSATLEDLRTRTRFVRITNAGIRESHVHDVTIVKEAPNYQISNSK
ncbi:MAG: IMP dehydrogenase [Arenicellales bacterium]